MRFKKNAVTVQLSLPALAAAALLGYTVGEDTFLLAVLFALAHEAGHLLAMKCCHIPIREIRLSVFGASILRDGGQICSYPKEIAVAAAGPAVNFLFALVCFFLPGAGKKAALCNLALGIFNILPVKPLDGEKILSGLLSLANKNSGLFLQRTAVVFILLIDILIAAAAAYSGFNGSLCAAGFFLLWALIRENT